MDAGLYERTGKGHRQEQEVCGESRGRCGESHAADHGFWFELQLAWNLRSNAARQFRWDGEQLLQHGQSKDSESDESIAEGTVTVGDLSVDTECVECVNIAKLEVVSDLKENLVLINAVNPGFILQNFWGLTDKLYHLEILVVFCFSFLQ